MTTTAPAIAHLLLRLRPLNRALRSAVERQQQAAARLARADVAALCITSDQVHNLLGDVDELLDANGDKVPATPCELLPDEEAAEKALRDRCAAANISLPLDLLVQTLELSPFEVEALLLCAAPEIDRSYERIYAYILDDLNRRYPCVELLSSLTAASLKDRLARRHLLSRFGHLRRAGLLQAHGQAVTELRQELRLGAGLLDFLTGASMNTLHLFRDSAEVDLPEEIALPEAQHQTIERLGRAIREQRVSVLGIWGPRHCGKEEMVQATAVAARLPLRRFRLTDSQSSGKELLQGVRDEVETASMLSAVLWVEADQFAEPQHEQLRAALALALAFARVPAILTGTHPWRPMRLLQTGGYTELELSAPTYQLRQKMWSDALPEIHESQINDLASRFRLSNAEMRAAAQVARTRAELNSNGHRASVGDELDAACAAITRRQSEHFATSITARRGPDDLVLPRHIHQQVIEVAQFFRAGAQVDETWGFSHMASGGGGVKALFTGEPGTGKTLAAEVIAHLLSLPLLKVDLARVVSKWVGETEKNLETVFREAEESHAVLFFDEADALFGKRGEVSHGSDRYANLEVGYLLQRLESYYGLVILASNLKDQIDAAFTRRFQIIIHFPLPTPEERRRIWQIAFPEAAPLDGDVELDALQRLELTGAGIVNAARTAALLAADQGCATIGIAHIVKAVARQYQREARILTSVELGSYATLLSETSR